MLVQAASKPADEEPATHSSTTKWPFNFVTDSAGRDTGWLVLHAPIQSPSRFNLYAEYRRRGFGFIGMTSFMTFPDGYQSGALDYTAICQGWAHCFRHPEKLLPPGQPRILLSLSDFIDPAMITPHRYRPESSRQEHFDFIYVCADQPWKMQAKNWPLAKRCLETLCTGLGLRGLVIGIDPRSIDGMPGLSASPWLPYESFLRLLAASRFLFVPNELDASPRVLTEALSLDTPVLVNRKLIGGWKYVSAATGRYFDDERNILPAAEQCLNEPFHPRPWYLSQFGPRRAGRTLYRLMKQIDPGFSASPPLGLGYSVSERR